MSDTPKTDAIAIDPGLAVTSAYNLLEVHARELEREVAKLTKDLALEKAAREDEVAWWNRERDQTATIESLKAEVRRLRDALELVDPVLTSCDSILALVRDHFAEYGREGMASWAFCVQRIIAIRKLRPVVHAALAAATPASSEGKLQ